MPEDPDRNKTRSRDIRRSRRGCRNCKLRKVKCDETKPHCNKCHGYGVLCNYSTNVPDLQPLGEDQSAWVPPGGGKSAMQQPKLLAAPRTRIVTAAATANSTISLELDAKHIELLNRAAAGMLSDYSKAGGGTMNGVLQLAHHYPFVMHAILAVSAAHERHQWESPIVLGHRTLAEMFHFSHCTTLFSRQLAQPVKPEDRDALWATASFLGILVFLAFDEFAPGKAWPFKDSSAFELDWLRMNDAKWLIWRLADPLRPDSIFNSLASVYQQMRVLPAFEGINGVLPALVELCNMDESSDADNNSYFTAAHAVSLVDRLPRSKVTLAQALTFISHLPEAFKTLLLLKEPVALLLLALWYDRTRGAVWWVELRAVVECKAICMYLRRYHSDNLALQKLVPCSAADCGCIY